MMRKQSPVDAIAGDEVMGKQSPVMSLNIEAVRFGNKCHVVVSAGQCLTFLHMFYHFCHLGRALPAQTHIVITIIITSVISIIIVITIINTHIVITIIILILLVLSFLKSRPGNA